MCVVIADVSRLRLPVPELGSLCCFCSGRKNNTKEMIVRYSVVCHVNNVAVRVCVGCACADVRLDQPQQGVVPAEPHGDRPRLPARRGAADSTQPLRHELHGRLMSSGAITLTLTSLYIAADAADHQCDQQYSAGLPLFILNIEIRFKSKLNWVQLNTNNLFHIKQQELIDLF